MTTGVPNWSVAFGGRILHAWRQEADGASVRRTALCGKKLKYACRPIAIENRRCAACVKLAEVAG